VGPLVPEQFAPQPGTSIRIPGPPGPGILGGVKIFWGGPARIYISRHPQPPAKYIGFSEISKVTNCYRILPVTFGNILLLAGSRGLGYSGIMKLSNFLDKYHSRKDKILILEKMLKIATQNKKQTISLKGARSVIFNHKDIRKI